ncbi:MAG: spore cortex biosynthesis protein YabQ [Syntrophomonadaceae bacterium]|nr:spore cortex biosynthesis protein YabQ [Syntrophomonadaceae bacterium]
MSGLLTQFKSFGLTLVLGVLAGGIFHYYQLTIRKARVSRYFLYVIDLILWIFMLLLVFASMLLINQGEMRLYVLIALLGGILIYYHYFSSSFYRTQSRMADFTVSRLAFVFRKSKQPFLWAAKSAKIRLEKYINPKPPEEAE